MTNYPNSLDTDASIPRIDDNITEIGAETINALREAIFSMQKALGENPQGGTASVVDRLNSIQNPDGTFKASAITAAGLIALPIINSQISATAAISESKLDLNVATQFLQDQVTSNDIDIEALQKAISEILNRLARHIAGTGYKHDGFDIYLDKTSPSVTPPAFISLTSTDVSNAIIEINNRFIAHASTSAIASHPATSISVVDNFITFNATNAQSAFEKLDRLRAVELITHRDEMHSNGFSNWSNFIDGYSIYNQLLPSELGMTVLGGIPVTSDRKTLQIDGYTLAAFGVTQGDVLRITAPADLAGQYIIDDVGPRDPIGSKALLSNSELEISTTFPYVAGELLSDAVTYFDGYVSLTIFAQSSLDTFQGNCAATVHQSGTTVDSVQIARPNAARAHSLGLNTRLINGTETLVVEVGVGAGTTRSITLTDLHKDRTGSVVPFITVDTIVERINSLFQDAALGNNFPASAYKVSDELVISHNWQGSTDYTLRVTSSGTGNFILGFDGYGADIVDKTLRPTLTTYFYVNGYRHTDFASIASGTATASGTQTIVVSGFNPLVAGVRTGHLLHVRGHTTTSENGTYFITGVSNNTISVHKSAGISAGSFNIEILHDAVPLDEFRNSAIGQIVEIYLDQNGRLHQNNRLEHSLISNLKVTNISDSFLSGGYTLDSTINPTSDYVEFQMGTYGRIKKLPRDFEGKAIVYGPSNIDTIELDVTNPVGAGTSVINVNQHINEEEFLEVCTVYFDGTLLLSNIKDKRLFGSTGLDEIREDYTQARIEVPQYELRSNGVVFGFDIIDGYYTDTSYSGQYGLLIRGGTAYIGGVRSEVATTPVMLPNQAGIFYVALNERGVYQVFENNNPYNLAELIDGYAGDYALIAKVEHNGTAIIQSNTEDLRFFINKIDDKLDIIVDITNRMIGNFATFNAALNYINNYPHDEKFKIKIVSNTNDEIVVDSNRDITLVIDGKVGGVTVASPCKIIAESAYNRDHPHIDGYLTVLSTCTDFTAEGLNLRDVDLYFSDDGTYRFNSCQFKSETSYKPSFISNNTSAIASISFNECQFDSTYGIINLGLTSQFYGLLRFNNCNFDGGATLGNMIRASSEYTVINGCRFNNWGYVQAAGVMTVVSDSIFENLTTSVVSLPAYSFKMPLSFGTAKSEVTNCIFDNITLNESNTSVVKATGYSSVANCVFVGCDASFGVPLVEISGSISNSKFISNTYSTSSAITCSSFISNENYTGIGDIIVDCQIFNFNTGFNNVTSTTLQKVSDNNFTSPTNTSLSIINLAGVTGVTISGNTFNVDANISAIQFNTNTSNCIISDNYFDGVGATSVGVALEDGGGVSNLLDTIISNNIFKEIVAVTTSSDDLSKLTFSGNQMLDQGITLRLGTDIKFENNACSNVTLTSGATINGLSLLNNIFASASTLTLSNAITDSVIEGNIGQFAINSTINNSIISGNKGDLSFGGSAASTLCIFSENVFDTFTSSTNTWLNTIISGNIFASGSTITLNILGNTQFENNMINSADISVSGTLGGISISNNIAIAAVASILLNSTIDSSSISRNINYNISVLAGSDNSIISLNNGTTDITLNGSVNSTIVDSNTCNNIDASCNSTTALSIKSNRVFVNISIFNDAGTYSISNMSVLNNTISGDISVGNGVTGVDTISISSTSFSSNNIGGDILIFYSGVAGATYNINNVIFQANTLTNIIFINALDNYGTITATDISILGNKCSGAIGFYSGKDYLRYDTITISQNQCNTISVTTLTDRLSIKENIIKSISNSIYVGFSGAKGALTESVDSINISSNILEGSFYFQFNPQDSTGGVLNIYNFIINNNIAYGTGGINFDLNLSDVSQTDINFIGLRIDGNLVAEIDIKTYNVLGNYNIYGGSFSYNTVSKVDSGIQLQSNTTNQSILSFVNISNNLALEETTGGAVPVPTQLILIDGAWKAISQCSISNNTGLGIQLGTGPAPANSYNFSFAGSIIGNTLISQNITLTKDSGTFVFQNTTISTNQLIDGSITISGITAADRSSITNNIIYTTGPTVSINLSSLSGNIERFIINDNVVAGQIDLSSSGVVSTVISGNNLTGSITGGSTLDQVQIIGNRCGGLELSAASTFTDCIISDNRLYTGQIDLSLSNVDNTIISGNNLTGSITGGSTLDQVQIIGNRCGGLDLSGTSGANAIKQCIISNNIIVGAVSLPAYTHFASGAGGTGYQTLISFNVANNWAGDLPNAINTGTTSNYRIFPWGNISVTAPAAVTFGGATSKSTLTANAVDSILYGAIDAS